MGLWELLLIAVGLSMDAFAISICMGLSMKKMRVRKLIIPGLYFGGFQALMPIIGYVLGAQFADYIESYDHWIAFVLLGIIGGKMIKESLQKDEGEGCIREEASQSVKVMLPLAVATSIDALAVGVTFAFLRVNIVPAALSIGMVTFLFATAGVKVGHIFGSRFKSKAEFAGGAILVLMGVKILLEHTGIL